MRKLWLDGVDVFKKRGGKKTEDQKAIYDHRRKIFSRIELYRET